MSEIETRKGVPFFQGVPTAPTVAALIDRTGPLSPGDMISHELIEDVVGEARNSNRYRSVVQAWKQRLYELEENHVLESVPGRGYLVLDPSRRITRVKRKMKLSFRRIIREGDIAMRTDTETLTDDERRSREHALRISAGVTLARTYEPKAIDFGTL